MTTIGIYGRFNGANIATSVAEALEDHGFNAVFFGPVEDIDTTVHQDAIILLTQEKGYNLLKQASDLGLSGVSLCPSVPNDSFSVVEVTADVFGSGNGLITTTIRNFLRTGVLNVHGKAEDELLLIEQEDLAETIVSVLDVHFSEGPQFTTAWGKTSSVTTLGDFCSDLWFAVNELAEQAADAGIGPFEPGALTIRSGGALKVKNVPEVTDEKFWTEYGSLRDGIKASAHRLLSEGEIPRNRARRYIAPDFAVAEEREDWWEFISQEPPLGLISRHVHNRLRTTPWKPQLNLFDFEIRS